MVKGSGAIKVVKQGSDLGNLIYFSSLSKEERLSHLECLRTQYIQWQNDPEPRFQRVYKVVRRA